MPNNFELVFFLKKYFNVKYICNTIWETGSQVKKNPFYGAVGFLTCFSVDPKNRTQNYQNLPLYSILKLTILGISKNKIFVAIFRSKTFVFAIEKV